MHGEASVMLGPRQPAVAPWEVSRNEHQSDLEPL